MSETLTSWRYCAEDEAGAVKNGFLRATDEAAAVVHLREQQLIAISIERHKAPLFRRLLPARDHQLLGLSDVADIARRLSDLLNAGLSLARAVDIGAKHAVNERQRLFFIDAAKRLGAGQSFSAAVADSDAKLPPLMQAILKSGERIGDMPNQLNAAAAHYDELLRLRREIMAQLAYPAALLVLIVLTLIFLSFFVLPQFQGIFETSGARPPIETRIALAGGAIIRNYIALSPIGFLIVLVAVRFVRARYTGLLDRLMLAAPVFGRIKRDAEIGRYCRTLSTSLSGGMSLSDAMPLAADTIVSDDLRKAALEIERQVRTGGRLAASVERNAKPSAAIISFLEIGEETGELAAMAGEGARFAETQTRSAIKKSMSILSPVLTAIMGLVTAAVIAAVMSGVLSLNDTML